MLAQNRKLSVVTAAVYLMAVCGAALFHNHPSHVGHSLHGGHEAQARSGVSVSSDHDADDHDDHDCSVCEFLAQKPAPAASVAPVHLGLLVQEVAQPVAESAVQSVFAAWQSRAPPVFA